MNARSLCAMAMVGLISTPAFASETQNLDLGEAVSRALERNYSIRLESLSPIIARARIEAERGRFDPALEASYSRSVQTEARRGVDQNNPDAFVKDRLTDEQWDVGLVGLLPWGTSYDLGWSVRNQTGTFNAFDDQYSSFLGLSVTQPLLQGAGSDVNTTSIRIARKDAIFSDWQFRSQVITTITDTLLAYYDLHASRVALAVAQESRDLAAQLLEDNIKRAEIGVMSPLDITTARAELAQRAERLLLAERVVRDNENLLKRLISADVRDTLGIRLHIVRPPLALSETRLDPALIMAFELRPDYRQAILQFEKSEITLVFQKNQVLPRLDVTASLGASGVDPDVGQSLEQTVNAKSYSWSVGAVFRLPIPNRTARSNRRVAELEVARSLLGMRQLEQEIIIAVDNALGQVFTSRQRIEASQQSRILAEESLVAEEEKLRAGVSTTFVVLELQRNLAEAQLIEIQALTDYNKSVASLDRETGATLSRWNVAIESVDGAPVLVQPVRRK